MRVLQLTTGLFPDQEKVAAALERLAEHHDLRRIDCTRKDMNDAAWDEALHAVLAADLVVTT